MKIVIRLQKTSEQCWIQDNGIIIKGATAMPGRIGDSHGVVAAGNLPSTQFYLRHEGREDNSCDNDTTQSRLQT